MKLILTSILVLTSTFLFAQTWDQKYEKAVYEYHKNEVALYKTEINKSDLSSFNDSQFDLISDKCSQKEGFIKIILSDSSNKIVIYHIEQIVPETISYILSNENLGDDLNIVLSDREVFVP